MGTFSVSNCQIVPPTNTRLFVSTPVNKTIGNFIDFLSTATLSYERARSWSLIHRLHTDLRIVLCLLQSASGGSRVNVLSYQESAIVTGRKQLFTGRLINLGSKESVQRDSGRSACVSKWLVGDSSHQPYSELVVCPEHSVQGSD